jgi:hypothetical protein
MDDTAPLTSDKPCIISVKCILYKCKDFVSILPKCSAIKWKIRNNLCGNWEAFDWTNFLFYWIFRWMCDWNIEAVLWGMQLTLYVVLRLLDECIILCVLLLIECVQWVAVTWLVVSHELWYMTYFTCRAVEQSGGKMKCKCNAMQVVVLMVVVVAFYSVDFAMCRALQIFKVCFFNDIVSNWYLALVIGEHSSRDLWWNDSNRVKLKYLEKNLSHCHFPLEIPHGMAWGRVRVSTLRPANDHLSLGILHHVEVKQ